MCLMKIATMNYLERSYFKKKRSAISVCPAKDLNKMIDDWNWIYIFAIQAMLYMHQVYMYVCDKNIPARQLFKC